MKFHVIKLNKVDSTNTYMKNLLADKELNEGTVILADFQNKGRGRGKNMWYSSQGRNLTFSILFSPKILTDNLFSLTEFISLSIADVLHKYGIHARIKWPNDIYVANNKIAGLLIENTLSDRKIEISIAGIGLNVNEEKFPDNLTNPVSMFQVIQREIDRNELLNGLLDSIISRYNQLISGNLFSIHEEYCNRLYLKDKKSIYKINGSFIEAKIIGVETSGELVLLHSNGFTKSYLFGEVEFVLKKE